MTEFFMENDAIVPSASEDGSLTAWARETAVNLLGGVLPHRLNHCLGVGDRAHQLAAQIEFHPIDPVAIDLVTAAGYVHDIGYATELVHHGHHAVDGALYLRRVGAPGALVSLVWWHSTAPWELLLCDLGVDLATVDQPKLVV
ncbi:MAG: HD domain-containing protein [Nocardioidaceae bacterium]